MTAITSSHVLAEVIICNDGSCGATLPMSMDRLQTVWRTKGIWKSVGLIFTGCMGLCEDAVNVRIVTRHRSYALARISDEALMKDIFAWAYETHTAGKLLPLPQSLLIHETDRLIG